MMSKLIEVFILMEYCEGPSPCGDTVVHVTPYGSIEERDDAIKAWRETWIKIGATEKDGTFYAGGWAYWVTTQESKINVTLQDENKVS